MKISKFIYNHDYPLEDYSILDRIDRYHRRPLIDINESVPINHVVCYRHKQWERYKGRYPRSVKMSSNREFWSAHTFEVNQRDPKGKGACDVSADNMRDLVGLIESHIKPSRIAVYDWGVHYDYCYGTDLKYYNSSWIEITRDEFWDLL